MNKNDFFNNLDDVSNDNVKGYIRLENIHKILSRRKAIAIISSGVVIMLVEFFRHKKWIITIENQYILSVIQIMIAFLLLLISSYLIHVISYRQSKDTTINFWDGINQVFSSFKLKSVFLLVSPDYIFAKAYKDLNKKQYKRDDSNHKCKCSKTCPLSKVDNISMCEYDELRITNKYFIEFSNWNNLIFTIILAVMTVVIWGSIGEFLFRVFSFFIAYRIVSRGIEIIIAFYNDVVKVNAIIFTQTETGEFTYVSNWKNSLILKTGRISLAIHSLLEIIFSFSILYALVCNSSLIDISGLPIKSGDSYSQYLLFSASVSVFNFSFFDYENFYLSIMHVSQVFLSMVLIVLSVARYLGLSDELTLRDERFFLNVELQRNSKSKN